MFLVVLQNVLAGIYHPLIQCHYVGRCFLLDRLSRVVHQRNDPSTDQMTGISSPIQVAIYSADYRDSSDYNTLSRVRMNPAMPLSASNATLCQTYKPLDTSKTSLSFIQESSSSPNTATERGNARKDDCQSSAFLLEVGFPHGAEYS